MNNQSSWDRVVPRSCSTANRLHLAETQTTRSFFLPPRLRRYSLVPTLQAPILRFMSSLAGMPGQARTVIIAGRVSHAMMAPRFAGCSSRAAAPSLAFAASPSQMPAETAVMVAEAVARLPPSSLSGRE